MTPEQSSRKRSLTIRGHRTSVSLEPEFWSAFIEIAAEQGVPANQLAAEIDERRDISQGLSSSLRVFVLEHFRRAESHNNSADKRRPGRDLEYPV